MGRTKRSQLVLISSRFSIFKTKRAPGSITGAFFALLFLPVVIATEEPALKLAIELFAEENWTACRTECSRILISNPENSKATVLKTVSELRCSIDSIDKLIAIADNKTIPSNLAAEASYEAGRALMREKKYEKAFSCLKKAFLAAEDKNLFLHAGCSLASISDIKPTLFEKEPALCTQLSTCSRLWTQNIRQECSLEKQNSKKGKAGRWVVAFYQSQISSAIGQRCSLYPSCSEYARIAFQQYGFFMGLAIYGDRAIREPDAVADHIEPKNINDIVKVRDLLEDHDFWLKKKRTRK